VRLQWWGLYHDKPKIGTFMLRVKLPAGHLTPAKLRAIGEVSNLYGRGDGELATRQNIQLHWLELARLPDVFAHLDRAGITTAGGMMVFVTKEEAVRVVTGTTTLWAENTNYRVSGVKARVKFMVDDIGPEGMRERVEAKLGRKLENFALPRIDVEPFKHLGVPPQKQNGTVSIGVPVHLGLISGDQMIAISDLAERLGGDVRVTR